LFAINTDARTVLIEAIILFFSKLFNHRTAMSLMAIDAGFTGFQHRAGQYPAAIRGHRHSM
jgi:hypothetical protein